MKVVVSGVELCSAAFLKNKNFVLSQGALNKVRVEVTRKIVEMEHIEE